MGLLHGQGRAGIGRRQTLATLSTIVLIGLNAPVAYADEKAWVSDEAQAEAAARQGNLIGAEQHYKAALDKAEQANAQDNSKVKLIKGLADICCKEGKVGEAQPLYQRLLDIQERRWGSSSPKLIPTLLDLASVYESQGNHSASEPLYNRIFAIDQATFGPNHPEVARSLHRLGSAYFRAGKYSESEQSFKHSIAILEQTLGSRHPELAALLDDYAKVLRKLNRQSEAEKLEARAKSIRESQQPQAKGGAIPGTPTWKMRSDSGAAVDAQISDVAEAALENAQASGLPDAELAPLFSTIAGIYYKQGQTVEAEPVLKRVIASDEQTLGPNHPALAADLINLSLLYEAQDRYREAEPLLKRAQSIFERNLGPDHPEVSQTLRHYAAVLRKLDRAGEAEQLESRTNSMPTQQPITR